MRQLPIARWAILTLLVLACSSDQLLDPVTDVPNLTVVGPMTHDFGDAPNGAYPTRLASNGAHHLIGSLFLGAAVDGEPDGQPNGGPNGASGDDKNGAIPDDEDGVMVVTQMGKFNLEASPLNQGAVTTVEVTASVGGGVLNAWIDFNFNGVWEAGAPEQIFIDVPLNMGVNSLLFTVPATAAFGRKFARFRVSTAAGLTPVGEAPDGEVEDYLVTIIEAGDFDYGDAPDGAYPTLLTSDGARHMLGSGLFLGAAVDAEPDGQPTGQPNGAAGDDQNGMTPDDEDGVTFTSALVPNAMTTVDVVASAAGVLNAWIDFNFNGVWEAGAPEQIFVNQPLAAGVNNLTFTVPAGTALGNKFARFRVNTTGGLSPSGKADDGEVEDYQVTIGELDFGDAPNGAYPTRLMSNGAPGGARHILSSGLFLGAAVDAELDGQPNGGVNGATGDDLNGATPDDEDGVVFTSALIPNTTTNTVDVIASAAGILNAWIDFNFNGIWESPSERIFTNQPLTPGTNSLMFAVPAGTTVGAKYARFRVNSTGGLLPTGLAADGEVEDYRVTVGELDFGDAPGVYPTKKAQNGARHLLSSSLLLGTLVDGELDGQPNGPTATGDDLAGGPDDEDGVMFTSALGLGSMATVDVVSSGTGMLNAWVDFNKNGVWEPSEQIFSNEPVAGGTNPLMFPVPGGAAVGNTFARFRLNAAGGLMPAGLAGDGEVEDYAVQITADMAPTVSGANPMNGATDVPVDSDVEITFTENVTVTGDWFQIVCGTSGTYNPTGSGGATMVSVTDADPVFTLDPSSGFANNEMCTVTVFAAQVTDDDAIDPPDNMASDFMFSFTTVPLLDFGDAPDPSFATLTASGGPSHTITSLTLGTLIDSEANGQPNGTATGDDVAGAADEDGVTFPSLVAGTATTVSVTASAASVLDYFFDFDGNGTFGNVANEVFTFAHPGGTVAVPVTIPAGAVVGGSFARFRLSTAGGLGPGGGPAADGEVEDYAVTIVEPAAVNDSYEFIGNVGLTVPDGAGDLTSNDPAGAMVTSVQGNGPCPCTESTTNGGTVTVQANGSFTFDPPAGIEIDDFEYNIGSGTGAPATVMFTFPATSPSEFWFIDENVTGGANEGTLKDPFESLADFETANAATGAVPDPKDGDVIFIFEQGGGNYTGGITLRNDQILIGQGATSSIEAIAGITLPTFSNTLPTTGGTNPTIVNAAGDGITLAGDNTIRGLNIGNTSGFGIVDPGSTVGSLLIDEVTVNNTTGGGIEIANGGVLDVTFDALTSTSSSGDGINLDGVSGTFDVTGTTDIDNPTTEGILISSSTGTFSFGAVDIDITNGSDGILLSSNTGATFNFNGPTTIDITGGSGLGFDATGGGTVNVTGTGNSISTTTGTALNVANTDIGSSGLTFQSISAGTGTSGPATGIILDNTGTAGGLSITGVDGPCGNTAMAKDCDGGTIQDVATAISLNETTDFSMRFMRIHDVSGDAINGTEVADGSDASSFSFEVTNSDFLDIGTNEATDEVMDFFEPSTTSFALSGTATIDNVLFDEDAGGAKNAFAGNAILVENRTGTLTLNVTNSVFQNPPVATSDKAVNLKARGSNTTTLNFQDNQVLGVKGEAVFGVAEDPNGASLDVNYERNEVRNTNPDRGGGVMLGASNEASLTFDILDNTAAGCATCGFFVPATAITISANNNFGNTNPATVEGRINRNLIDMVPTSGGAFSDAISIFGDGNETANTPSPPLKMTVEIDENTIRDGDEGIEIDWRQQVGSTTNALNLTITDNVIGTTANPITDIGIQGTNIVVESPFANVLIERNSIVSPNDAAIDFRSRDDATVNLTVRNNSSINSTGSNELELDTFDNTSPGTTPSACLDMNTNTLPGGTGATIDVSETDGSLDVVQTEAVLSSSNSSATITGTNKANVNFGVGGTCTVPTLPSN